MRLERPAVALVVLLAFALRLFRLGAQPIWWDESLSVYRARLDLSSILANTILIQRVVTHDTLPPLYFVILHFLVPAFGTGEFALRFFSVAANLATIPLIYVLARRMLALVSPAQKQHSNVSWPALLAALLAAISPFYVWFAQEARPYALVLFWSTLAVYALFRAFDGRARFERQAGFEKQAGGEREMPDPAMGRSQSRRILWVAVYVVAATAALYTHLYSLFLIPFHVVVIALLAAPGWRQWLVLPALPALAALAMAPSILASMTENAGTGPYFVQLDVILRDVINSFAVGITIGAGQVVWIDAALVALYVIGIAFVCPVPLRTRLVPGLLILAYLIVPVLAVYAASFVRPLYQNSRYLISISPAFYVGVAAGVAALARRWRLIAVPALAVYVTGAALSLSNLYTNPAFGKDDHRAWAESLRERVRPGDLLVLDSPHTQELFRYYADDVVPWISLPLLGPDRKASLPAQDLAAVRNAYSQNRRVWFLTMDVPFDDPERRIETLLNQGGMLLDRAVFPATSTELALALYVPALPVAAPGEIAAPLDISFIGNMRLKGFTAPASLVAGKTAVVQLYWQIDEPVGEDYAVSLRLVDGAGTAVAQLDSVPLGNQAGSSKWPPRTIIADAHELPLSAGTPPGQYRLQTVPYHAATGSALGDVVTLCDILVSNAEVR